MQQNFLKTNSKKKKNIFFLTPILLCSHVDIFGFICQVLRYPCEKKHFLFKYDKLQHLFPEMFLLLWVVHRPHRDFFIGSKIVAVKTV